MDLPCPLRTLSSSCVLSTNSPSHSNFSRCHHVRASLHQHTALSCMAMTLQGTSTCRGWVSHDRNCLQMVKCRYAAETSPESVTDSATEKSEVVGDEDEDYPFWMEEDDPNWPEDDPNGDGVGFQISNFFEPKVMNVPNEDGSSDGDSLDVNWEAEQYQWIVREISSAEWESVARDDPTPLIFFAFERYGPRGQECWKLLEELEKVVRIIVDSRRYPIRAVKLDISSEPAVGDALKIKQVPSLLFIDAGKLLYRLSGMKTADELLAITSHVFYHSARPDCMDELETSHTVTNISSSG